MLSRVYRAPRRDALHVTAMHVEHGVVVAIDVHDGAADVVGTSDGISEGMEVGNTVGVTVGELDGCWDSVGCMERLG